MLFFFIIFQSERERSCDMKKNCVNLLLVGVCFLCIYNSCGAAEIINCSMDDRSIPVYVTTKGENSPPFAGGKVSVTLGQYITGRDGQLVNVTGMTRDELFKAGLASYGLKSGSLKTISRYVSDSHVLYIFDYK
ncbi:MAG: hypothetical protein WCK16_05135 [Candidatus Moraniibacteriota bacterium]